MPSSFRPQRAQKEKDVYDDIFSVIIDLTFVESIQLNKAMQLIHSDRFQIIEWDRRTEYELRVFITPWDEWSKPVVKKIFFQLQSILGVRVLCVPTAFGFS